MRGRPSVDSAWPLLTSNDFRGQNVKVFVPSTSYEYICKKLAFPMSINITNGTPGCCWYYLGSRGFNDLELTSGDIFGKKVYSYIKYEHTY